MSPQETLWHPVVLIALPGKLPRRELPRLPAQGTVFTFAVRPTRDGFKTDSFVARVLRTELWSALVIEVPEDHPAWDDARAIRGDIERELPYHLEKD